MKNHDAGSGPDAIRGPVAEIGVCERDKIGIAGAADPSVNGLATMNISRGYRAAGRQY